MKKRLVLSISYGYYKNSCGGTDKVILSHSQMFNEAGFKYVYLFPVNVFHNYPIPRNPFWGLVEDGEFLGAFHTSGILDYLNKLCVDDGWSIACAHIHHLMYVNIGKLGKIISALDCDVYFYVHDFYNVCRSTNMLRSDNHKLCHGTLDKAKCAGCGFYKQSVKHKKAFLSLLKLVSRNCFFVCPSDSAKKQFVLGYPELSDKTIVICHQTFSDEYSGNRDCRFPVKIAYIGSPLPDKGWNQFSELAQLYAQNKAYEFYYFCKKEMDVKAKHIVVDFREDLNAMTKALRENEIDCVLLWTLLPETYSYTYYEAYCSNCFIISNPDSGNVQNQVKKRNSGIVFENEEDLYAFFENSDYVRDCIADYKRNSKNIPLNAAENNDVVKLAMEKEPSALKKKNYRSRNIVEKTADKLIECAFRWRKINDR